MRYILSTQCRVPPEKMEGFLRDVQQWEEAALTSPHSPEYHAVHLRHTDPSAALIVTQFASKEAADAFAATGLLARFHEEVLSCAVESSEPEGYDLYYGAGPAGPRIVFGQESVT